LFAQTSGACFATASRNARDRVRELQRSIAAGGAAHPVIALPLLP
jgi:hypothetical protein